MFSLISNSSKKILVTSAFAMAMVIAGNSVAFAQQTAGAKPTVEQAAQVSKVDINKADAEALAEGLVGVGSSKAKAIVEYRKTHGPFTSLDQLIEVTGIGEAILANNRDRLKIEGQ